MPSYTAKPSFSQCLFSFLQLQNLRTRALQLNRENRKGEANCLEQDLSGSQSLVHSLDLTSEDQESQLFFSVHSDVIKL